MTNYLFAQRALRQARHRANRLVVRPAPQPRTHGPISYRSQLLPSREVNDVANGVFRSLPVLKHRMHLPTLTNNHVRVSSSPRELATSFDRVNCIRYLTSCVACVRGDLTFTCAMGVRMSSAISMVTEAYSRALVLQI